MVYFGLHDFRYIVYELFAYIQACLNPPTRALRSGLRGGGLPLHCLCALRLHPGLMNVFPTLSEESIV